MSHLLINDGILVLQGLTISPDGDTVIDAEEYMEMEHIQERKAFYRSTLEQRQAVKEEIESIRCTINYTRQRLVMGM